MAPQVTVKLGYPFTFRPVSRDRTINPSNFLILILDGHLCRGGNQFCRSEDNPGATVVLILLISSPYVVQISLSVVFSRKTIAELQERAESLEEAKQKADREVECMRALVSGLSPLLVIIILLLTTYQ